MIYKKIEDEIIKAMKERNASYLLVLRSMKTNIKNQLISQMSDTISDEEVIKIIRKMIKQREDSLNMFKTAGDLERQKVEANEIDILNTFVPSMASEDDTRKVVEEVVKGIGGEISIKQKGMIIKQSMEKLGGNADGKILSKITDEYIK